MKYGPIRWPLAKDPELTPPGGRSMLAASVVMVVVGILIALAASISGQNERREGDVQRKWKDLFYWQSEVSQAKLAVQAAATSPDPAATQAAATALATAEKNVGEIEHRGIISYARPGRQFTQWDGYRYEEIIDGGYVYHLPSDPPEVKEDSHMRWNNEPEKRTKNVVWYPLYPAVAWLVMKASALTAWPLTSTSALTAVSWVCALAGAAITFLMVRRHFFTRAAALGAGAGELQGRSPWDDAALWTVAFVFFGPCGIFYYANFTESLFILLFAGFLYCIQSRWWWRAALIAAVASSCRSQGVMFGPILAMSYLVRARDEHIAKRITVAGALGCVSAVGLLCYVAYLQVKFGDPLAFMHAQKHWNVGMDMKRLLYAANPTHVWEHLTTYAWRTGTTGWPRLWEGICLVWPPILLLAFGWRYLSLEMNVVGWILWGLPFVSNSMAGYPPFDSQWMSMGRFMAAALPLQVIMGGLAGRFRWLGPVMLVASVAVFAYFSYKYGAGAWIG